MSTVPNRLDLTTSHEVVSVANQHQPVALTVETQLTPAEVMIEQDAMVTDPVDSFFIKCTLIASPLLAEEDGKVYIEHVHNKETLKTEEYTQLNQTTADEEYECLFNFLLSNVQEEATYTVN